VLKRIRFDDVLWSTSDEKIKGKELQKFKKHVNWCKNIDILLTPAVLCQDIEKFPECIEYIREETEQGNLYPDLHGYDHGPYADRSVDEVKKHLEMSIEWFYKNLGVTPIRWVTPHGANTVQMQDAARVFGLVIEDTSYPVLDQKELDTDLRLNKDLSVMKNRILMVHWWERGLRLYRIARIIEYGSVAEAIKITKTELDLKSWKICWNEEWHEDSTSR